MIEWSTIALAVVGSVSIGEIINIFTIRETRKGMKLDNKEKEDSRWERLADQLQDENRLLQEQNSTLHERLEKKDARIIELEDRCGDLRARLDEANTNLAKASLLKCTRLSCSERKPPLGYAELTPEELMAERLLNKDE